MIISKEQYNKLPEELKIYFKEFKNIHPTVKNIKLCEYLIKMVTPKGGIVLEPFAGSGTTLVACKRLGYQFIGIEKEPEYIKIINARLSAIKEEQKQL